MQTNPRSYAIGDVHGCVRTLERLLSFLPLQKGDQLYFLGDYIDRGPDSKAVIDLILSLPAQGYGVTTLRGNHEQMFMDSELGDWRREVWLRNGGDIALQNFGVQGYPELSPLYKQFFEQTLLYHPLPGHILVHAGLNFKTEDLFSDQEYMLWSRAGFIDKEKLGGKVLVHGHTPTPLKQILEQSPDDGVINLDGGCVYRGVKGLGYLVAMNLASGMFYFEKCCD